MSCDKHTIQSYMLGLVCKPETLNKDFKPKIETLKPEP